MLISKILSKIDISNLRFKRSPEKEKEKLCPSRFRGQ